MGAEIFWAREAILGELNGIPVVRVTVWYACMVGVSSIQSFNEAFVPHVLAWLRFGLA